MTRLLASSAFPPADMTTRKHELAVISANRLFIPVVALDGECMSTVQADLLDYDITL